VLAWARKSRRQSCCSCPRESDLLAGAAEALDRRTWSVGRQRESNGYMTGQTIAVNGGALFS
jgi:hypothetical protein